MCQVSLPFCIWFKSYGQDFLTLLLQIKYATPDNPNNVGLTLAQKIIFCKLDESGFFISLKIY